ncbi:MAG: hypothetical protein GY909_13900 [Oligoflexia bacterium]|nr:hypothetical protein [Oligoflexia bacterium]
MKTLLTIERHILELIEKKPQSLSELRKKLDINIGVLNEVLFSLISMRVITKNNSRYEVNKQERKFWLKNINNEETMKAEFNELFESLLNEAIAKRKSASLKLKKVELTATELWHLEEKYKEIEKFIELTQAQRKIKNKPSEKLEQHVLIFGNGNYQELVTEPIRRYS